jgi:Cu2+-containing amine oxidase
VQAAAFQSYYRNNFGYPLMFNISGTLHTHVLAWKVDLDIAGTSNSINIHHMKVCAADSAGTHADAAFSSQCMQSTHMFGIHERHV